MTIALLCPTRERPEQCKRMVESAFIKSTASIQIYLGVQGDGYRDEFPGIWLPRPNCMTIKIQMPEWPTVQSWNVLANGALENKKNKLFMLAADDMHFATPGWDKALLDHYNALENEIHVYALQDSRDKDGTPHVIVTREYIEAMGYFMPPIFLHFFIDTWTVAIAKANGVFTHMRDYLLVHDKSNDKGQPDETHSRIRAMGWRERDGYVNDTCQHFLALEKSRLKLAMLGESHA